MLSRVDTRSRANRGDPDGIQTGSFQTTRFPDGFFGDAHAQGGTWRLSRLAGAPFLGGATDAITDVAQNSRGLRAQLAYGRSILGSFHAVWSVGAMLGGTAAGLSIPRGIHVGVSLALFSAVVLVSLPLLLPGAEPRRSIVLDSGTTADDGDGTANGSRHDAGTSRVDPSWPRIAAVLADLVLVAIGGTLVADAGSSWAAIYLQGTLGAIAPLAALGFGLELGPGGLPVHRAYDRGPAGGPLRPTCRRPDRWRADHPRVRTGTGLPSVPGTIIGFGIAADELPGLRPGTGLTILGWLMRLGFLFSPPIVGAIADSTSLATGLLVVPLAGVLVVACSSVLKKQIAAPG